MKNDQLILSVDIGTSAVKCGLFDLQGNLSAAARAQVPLDASKDAADRWEQAYLRALGELNDQLPMVAAVCVCGNGPTVIPVDTSGNRCGVSILWNDPEISGFEGGRSLFLPVVKLANERSRKIGASVRWFAGCPEYIAGRMTGEWHTFLPSPEFAPFIWEEEEAKSYQVPFNLLPPMLFLGELAGNILPSFAQATGLRSGVPVYAGGPDYLMALFGTAVIRPGRLCDRAGSSEALNVCIEAETFSQALEQGAKAGLRILPHSLSGKYSAAVLLPPSGLLFHQILASAEKDSLSGEDLLQQMFSITWLDDSYLPLIRDTYRMIGESAPAETCIQHLAEKFQKGQWPLVGRIISEVFGWFMVRGMKQLDTLGCQIPSLRISGGQAYSEGWNQLKADILHLPVEIPAVSDAELVGCAAVCLTSEGRFPSVEAASEALYTPRHVVFPEEQRSGAMREREAKLFPPPSLQKQP